jgi:phenylacetate-CoA ligase
VLASRLKRTRVGDRLARRNPAYYGRALRLFDRLEESDLESRRRFTEKRLRVALAAARRTRYGAAAGGGTSLDDWPLLDKDAVRDDPEAFRQRRFATAPASTSGTTGTPLALVRSPQSVAVEQAAIDRLALRHGIDLRTARVAVLRGDDVGAPAAGRLHWRDDVSGRRRVFQSNDLTETTLPQLRRALAELAPSCLLAYPTVLELVCSWLAEHDERLGIPLTLTSSEVLTPTVRELAEDVLATKVVDYYGQAERVNFAYSFEAGAYVFLPGYAMTELVPVDGDTYEIVGTSLWNAAMPLVRYRTGDFVRLPSQTTADAIERICFGLEPVDGIVGRADDYLVAPDGGRVVGVDHIPRDVANVLRVQVIQERRDAVRILVRAKPSFGDEDRRQLEENARRKLPPAMAYTVDVVPELETRGGKTPLVIRRS